MLLANINTWRARPLSYKMNFPELAALLGILVVDLALGSRFGFEFIYDANLQLATPLLVVAGLSSVLGFRKAIMDMFYFAGLWIIALVVYSPLSYFAAMSGFEVHDTTLAAADRLVGFHWPEWARFIHAHNFIDRILQWCYASIGLQTLVSVLYFSARSMTERNLELFWTALVSLSITLAVFALYPALGPIPYFDVKSETAPYLPHLLQLRDGTLHGLPPGRLQGLISFPSYHTVCACIFMYVHRRQRYAFPVVAVLNTLMILSTPSTGGHYLVDILAGFAVVALSVAIVRYALQKRCGQDIGQ